MISKALDRLVNKFPVWGKFIFFGLTVVGSVYYISHYGFWHFLLRMIFSP